MLSLDYGDTICPLCQNHSLLFGEEVDIGVGAQRVTADCCEVCGFTNDWRLLNHQDLAAMEKCWELQLDYWNQYGRETKT